MTFRFENNSRIAAVQLPTTSFNPPKFEISFFFSLIFQAIYGFLFILNTFLKSGIEDEPPQSNEIHRSPEDQCWSWQRKVTFWYSTCQICTLHFNICEIIPLKNFMESKEERLLELSICNEILQLFYKNCANSFF